MGVDTRKVPADRELHEFSVSRLGLAGKCGLAFKYRYVDKLPAPYDSAAAMFGNVMHSAIEGWYGEGPITDDNRHQHKDLDLVKLVEAQWEQRLPPKIWEGVEGLLGLQAECVEVAQAIHLLRPELKNPDATVAYRTSDAKKALDEAKDELQELTDGYEHIKWPQNEDPLKAYLTSRLIATRLQNEWRPLPRPLLVEMPFKLEFEGWTLWGQIDQLRQDPDLSSGQMQLPRTIDTKTGKNPLSQMEGFLQAYLYSEAVCNAPESMGVEVPATRNIGFALLRFVDERGRTKVQKGQIDPKRHKRIALRILHGNTKKVLESQFEPSYGFWCRGCDFRELCIDEIHMWEGDGIVAGKEVTANGS